MIDMSGGLKIHIHPSLPRALTSRRSARVKARSKSVCTDGAVLCRSSCVRAFIPCARKVARWLRSCCRLLSSSTSTGACVMHVCGDINQ